MCLHLSQIEPLDGHSVAAHAKNRIVIVSRVFTEYGFKKNMKRKAQIGFQKNFQKIILHSIYLFGIDSLLCVGVFEKNHFQPIIIYPAKI